MKSERIAVIGAGLGGLSAALKLSHNGFKVDVYEKLDSPGGKAAELRAEGYRFDMGPSLLTLPGVFRDLFESVDERFEDHLKIVRLDPITRYFFPDGTILNACSNILEFAEEVEEKLGEKSQKVIRYLERCRRTYEASTPIFMFKPLQESSTLLSTDTIKAFMGTPKMDAFRTMHQVNSKWFSDKRAIQLFDRYATYNGSSPYLTPATFNLIQHVEYGMGGFAVKGGIHKIPRTIEKLAVENGAVFHYGEEAEEIVTANGQVEGIRISGKKRNYKWVIANGDVTRTYENLLKDDKSQNARKYKNLEPSSSGQVFLWGINREFDGLTVNNILFSEDYRKEFDDIWKKGRSPGDPTVYINITSKIDQGDAARRGENWFILVNVPYDSGQDWKMERDHLRIAVLKRIEKVLGPVSDLIEVEKTLGPIEIENRYGGNRGSIYGISSNNRASAFLRQPNRSREYRGLFFAGGSAHPGGGMPLVVLSGIHAADLLMKYIE
jgi:phytoene desaturase